TGVKEHLIEPKKGTLLLRRLDSGFQHEVMGDAEVAGNTLRETLPQLLRGEIGQKSQFAEIDAEDRSLPIAHLPGSSQDRAVPAEHERQIRRETAQVFLLVKVEGNDFAVLAQERQQLLGVLLDSLPIGITQDENAHRSST